MKKSHIAAAALAALGSLFATQALADGHYVPGVEGMLISAAWPAPDPALDFPEETARMEGIMEIVRAVRNMRAEMNVAPGRRARLIVKPHAGWADALSTAEGFSPSRCRASARPTGPIRMR